MEITLEMVERLREKAGVSYALAKQALEYSEGNLLDALIYLEDLGAIPRQEEAYYSTRFEAVQPSNPGQESVSDPSDQAEVPERRGMKGVFSTLRRWMVDNELEIWRREKPVTALPVLIVVLLVLFAFWIVVPMLILALFFGFRYRFAGPDLERDEINSVMGSVAETAAELGGRVMDELRAQQDRRGSGDDKT